MRERPFNGLVHRDRPGFAVAGQPDTLDRAGLAALGYRTTFNNRLDGEEAGQMPAASARAVAERLGLAYVHISITTSAIGESDVAALDRAMRQNPSPIVAHCRSGTRSYLPWAAARALNGGGDPAALAAAAAGKGYDLKLLPNLVAWLRQI